MTMGMSGTSVAASVANKKRSFLTQTRPDLPSPLVHRAFSPQSAMKTQSTVTTEPMSPILSGRMKSQHWDDGGLEAAFFDATQEPSEQVGPSSSQDSPGLMRRLRRREGSMGPPPVPLRNAFSVLKANASKPMIPKKRLEKSEYVEDQAAESDDEADFGGRGSGDEADGEDLDQDLKEIVDDAHMTDEQLAKAEVEALHQEQKAKEDEELGKKIQEVVEGKMRKRKRNQGLDDEDDDELADEEREERNAAARRKMMQEAFDKRTDLKALSEWTGFCEWGVG